MYVLQVATGHTTDWPGITVKAPKHPWGLSKYTEIALNVKNIDSKPLTLNCRVDCPGGDGENYQIGLLDICDKPYPETIKAVRDVGSFLYTTRMHASATQPADHTGPESH